MRLHVHERSLSEQATVVHLLDFLDQSDHVGGSKPISPFHYIYVLLYDRLIVAHCTKHVTRRHHPVGAMGLVLV